MHRQRFGFEVEPPDVMLAFEEVVSHGQAHGAETDESDGRHDEELHNEPWPGTGPASQTF